MRKVANLPVLRGFTGYSKAEGIWMVFDFKYTYNRNDYYNWILKEGENYYSTELDRVQNEWEEWRQELHNNPDKFWDSINRVADKSVSFLYDWANQTMELQIKDIQKMGRESKKMLELK